MENIVTFLGQGFQYKSKPTNDEEISGAFKRINQGNQKRKPISDGLFVQLLETGTPHRSCSWLGYSNGNKDVPFFQCNMLIFDFDAEIITEKDKIEFESLAAETFHFLQASFSDGIFLEKEENGKLVRKKYRYHGYLKLAQTIDNLEQAEIVYKILKQFFEEKFKLPLDAKMSPVQTCYASNYPVQVNELPLYDVPEVNIEQSNNNRKRKKEDPRLKDNVVGAFCRKYNIHQVIEHFLSDTYIKTKDKNRYTYNGSTGEKGAVVYDDIFLFSNHSTDPGCNRSFNSFELVMLHKFNDNYQDAKQWVMELLGIQLPNRSQSYYDSLVPPAEIPVFNQPGLEPQFEWADLSELGKKDIRLPFPEYIFKDEVKEMLSKIATIQQVPFDPVGALMFGAASTLLMGKLDLQISEGRPQTLNTYTKGRMPSGSNKTGPTRTIKKPLQKIEKERMEKAKTKVAKIESERAMLERRKKYLEKKIAEAWDKTEDNEVKVWQIEKDKVIDGLANLEIIHRGEIFAEDITPEAVPQFMAENGEMVTFITDEGAIVQTMEGRFNDNSNTQIYLDGFEGTTHKKRRTNGESIVLENPLITICALVQPGKDKHKEDVIEEGLPHRFMTFEPHIEPGKRTLRTPAFTAQDEGILESIIRKIDCYPGGTLTFSEEAYTSYEKFYNMCQCLMLPGEEFSTGTHKNWMNKAAFIIARYIALLHVLGTLDEHSPIIQEDTVLEGVQLFEYFKSHYLFINGNSKEDSLLDPDTEYLLDYLKKHKKQTWNISKLANNTKRMGGAANVRKSLEVLQEMGYVKLSKEKKPKTVEVHPVFCENP